LCLRNPRYEFTDSNIDDCKNREFSQIRCIFALFLIKIDYQKPKYGINRSG
jgi:hypothetical protein